MKTRIGFAYAEKLVKKLLGNIPVDVHGPQRVIGMPLELSLIGA